MIDATDLDVNRAVRRILVKHWIDLGRVSVRTTNGRVLIFGILRRIEGHRESLSPPAIDAMFYEIKRIKGANHVRAHFDNWTNDGGRWHPQERSASTARPNAPAAGDDPDANPSRGAAHGSD